MMQCFPLYKHTTFAVFPSRIGLSLLQDVPIRMLPHPGRNASLPGSFSLYTPPQSPTCALASWRRNDGFMPEYTGACQIYKEVWLWSRIVSHGLFRAGSLVRRSCRFGHISESVRLCWNLFKRNDHSCGRRPNFQLSDLTSRGSSFCLLVEFHCRDNCSVSPLLPPHFLNPLWSDLFSSLHPLRLILHALSFILRFPVWTVPVILIQILFALYHPMGFLINSVICLKPFSQDIHDWYSLYMYA